MKIRFDAPYPEVAARLNSPANASPQSTSGGSFGRLLAEELMADEQGIKSARDLLGEPDGGGLRGAARGPMASFRFSPPDPQFADPHTTGLTPQPDPVVNPPERGVKTPSVLSVRRTNGKKAQLPLARAGQLQTLAATASKRHGVDSALSMSVMMHESAFDPHAVSKDGHESKGLFQFIDRTAKEAMKRLGLKRDYDPFDPGMNIELGVGHLRHLHQIFSAPTTLHRDIRTVAAANSASLEKLAVAAFNAGEGRVAHAQSRAQRDGFDPAKYEDIEKYLPKTTQEYVRRVVASKDLFGGPFIG